MIVTSYYLEDIRKMYEDKAHNLMSIDALLREIEGNG